MLSVEVRDFQSISSASFTIDGFTALTGRSNIGKSAAVRALKCALTAAEGSDFVRHDPSTCSRILKGSKKCQCNSAVLIKFDNGDKLLWEKGDAINQYTSWLGGDKQVYSRVGRNPDLPEILRGFEPVKIGDRSRELVQVSDQFNPIFLLDVPGPTVADVLSDVAQLDDVNVALKLVTRDRKEASATLKVREADIKRISASLEAYASLTSVSSSYLDIEKGLKVLQGHENLHRSLVSWLEKTSESSFLLGKLNSLLESTVLPDPTSTSTSFSGLQRLTSWLLGYNSSLETLQSLEKCLEKSPPEVDLQKAFSRVANLISWRVSFDRTFSSVVALEKATSKDIPEADALQDKLTRLRTLSTFLVSFLSKARIFASLKGVTEIPEVEPPPVGDTFLKLSSLLKFNLRLSQAKASLEKLDAKTLECSSCNIEELQSRLSTCEFLFRHMTQVTKVEGSLVSVTVALQEVDRDLEELSSAFSSLGVCPTCSQPITPDHQLDLTTC